MVFTVLHPLILIISITTVLFKKRRHGGPIALPADEEAVPSGMGAQSTPANANGSGEGARRVWG